RSFAERLAESLTVTASDNNDLFYRTVQHFIQDVSDERFSTKGQQELLRSHPHRAPGSEHDGANHVGSRIGIARNRTPVARNTALPMAGATAMIGVSPAPTDERSVRFN